MDELLKDAPLWVVWIMQFLAIELPALFNAKKGDTLTEVVRYVFGFSTRAGDLQSTGMKWRRGSFYAFSVALFGHFVGWW